METIGSVKEKIVWASKVLFDRGLIEVYDGNISYRFAENYFIITPSHVPKNSLKIDDLVVVYFNDRWSNVKGLRPSVEYRMHKLIYLRFDAVKAIVHAHNPCTVALTDILTNIDEALLETTTETKYYIPDGISVIPRLPPGSIELAEAVANGLKGPNSLAILRGHGVVGVGETLEDALHRVLVAERNAKMLLIRSIAEKFLG